MNQFIEKIKQNSFVLQILTLMSGTLVAQVVLLAFIPILTRLYTPTEFGNYSLFFILSTIIGSVSSLRYEQAIMLPKSNRDAQTLLFISALLTIFISLLLSLILVIFYDFFLDYFNQLSYLIWLLPLSVLVTGLVQILNSYSTRNRFYKKMAGVKVIESITTVGTQSISRYFLALDGLIVGKFLSNLYTLYLLSIYHLKKQTLQLKYFNPRRVKANLKRHENFPKYFAMATLLNSISQNIPILLFTTLFSPAVTGFYALTHRILQAPIQLVANSTRAVYYQKASQLYANREDIRPLYFSTTKGLIKLFILPYFIILIWGQEIFSLLFGEEWITSGVIAQITIIWFFFTFINPPVTVMYNIFNEQKAQLLFQIMGIITRTLAILAGFYIFDSYIYSIILFTVVSVIHNLLIFGYIYQVTKKIYNKKYIRKQQMRLTFFGDTVLDKPYRLDFDFDKFIFNLETPLSCDGTPALNKVNVCQEESHIQATFGSTPLAVSMANNHVMDFGEEAFEKTKKLLDEQNIPYFGAGFKGDNFNNPKVIEFGDKKIGLCGYCCPSAHPTFGDEKNNGSAYLDPKEVIKDIKTLQDKKVDMIIVQPHWGIQEIPFPTFNDREMAHLFIDSGADMVIGHHAHVIQSYEVYNGKHIFYGLGNFIFPDLNLPSYHNGKEFTVMRYKIQHIQHRRSMVVTLDEQLNVDFYGVVLKGETIKKSNFKLPTWLPNSEKEFQKKLSMQYKINMLKKFLAEPKIPTLAHFKRFAKLFKK